MRKKVAAIGWSFLQLCLVLAVAMAIGELWIRVFIPVKNICYLSDPVIGARFCPNQKTFGYVEKGYSNVLLTNSMGFHDVERTRRKTPGTFRIQIYGDSMIQGYCVPMDKTIPRLLEQYLNEGSPSPRFEVLNMAPGEDGTSSQFMTYQEIGKHLEPDLVISYFMDDFPDNVIKIHERPYSPYHRLSSNGGLEFIAPRPKDISTLWERVKRTSFLYRHLANKVLESKAYHDLLSLKKDVTALVQSKAEKESDFGAMDFQTYRKYVCVNESWPLTLRLIEHFDRTVKKDGTMFLLVEAAEFYEETVGSVHSNKEFEGILESKGIWYLPVYEEYSKIKARKEFDKYFFKDHHLKPVGNEEMARFVAQKLRGFLNDKGIVPITDASTGRSAARENEG